MEKKIKRDKSNFFFRIRVIWATVEEATQQVAISWDAYVILFKSEQVNLV